MKNSGYIIVYIDKEGNDKQGVAYHSKQANFLPKRILINLCDKDGNHMKDDLGKDVVALKQIDLVKVIGYVD